MHTTSGTDDKAHVGDTFPTLELVTTSGQRVTIPDAHHVHLFVARGAVDLDGAGRLVAGDAARLTAAGSPSLTADPAGGAEVLVWETE